MTNIDLDKDAPTAASAGTATKSRTPLETTFSFTFMTWASAFISVLRGVLGGSLVAYGVTTLASGGNLNAVQWAVVIFGALLILVDFDNWYFKPKLEPLKKDFDEVGKTLKANKDGKLNGEAVLVSLLILLTVGLVFAVLGGSALIFSIVLFNALQAGTFSFASIAWLCITGVWLLDAIKGFIKRRVKKLFKKEDKGATA
jgi:hypothetical protein